MGGVVEHLQNFRSPNSVFNPNIPIYRPARARNRPAQFISFFFRGMGRSIDFRVTRDREPCIID